MTIQILIAIVGLVSSWQLFILTGISRRLERLENRIFMEGGEESHIHSRKNQRRQTTEVESL